MSPSSVPARDGFWRRLLRGIRRIRERPDWPRFAGPNWADRIMEIALTDDFHAKQGRSTGRWVLHAGGKQLAVYLKRHERLSWWRGLLATLWPGHGWSPAMQERRHLAWARARSFPVPQVFAAGEYIGPWGRLRSFIAVQELTGMLPLHQAIPAARRRLDARTFHAWKRSLTIELARLSARLHALRHFHKDLYLCHFFVPEADTYRAPADWAGRVHLIDLHRLAHHTWTWRTWQLKDLSQLLYSSHIDGVTARDRLRFWRYYLGPDRRRLLNRVLAWCVRLKSRRYLDHNAKKKLRDRERTPDQGQAA